MPFGALQVLELLMTESLPFSSIYTNKIPVHYLKIKFFQVRLYIYSDCWFQVLCPVHGAEPLSFIPGSRPVPVKPGPDSNSSNCSLSSTGRLHVLCCLLGAAVCKNADQWKIKTAIDLSNRNAVSLKQLCYISYLNKRFVVFFPPICIISSLISYCLVAFMLCSSICMALNLLNKSKYVIAYFKVARSAQDKILKSSRRKKPQQMLGISCIYSVQQNLCHSFNNRRVCKTVSYKLRINKR